MKYQYDELMIEITRKCNLQCAHCLRGDAQNITMSKEVIDKIFEDAADCKQLLFTGGEPLLALDEIEYFVDKVIASDWTTSNIAMTINGTIRNPKLIDIANRFCRSRNGSTFQIIISDDEFHNKTQGESTLKFYRDCEHENFVFVIPQKNLLKETKEEFTLAGRAIEYYKNHPQLDSKWSVRKEEQTNHRLCILKDRIPCAMYVTVHGGFESYVGEEFSTVDRLSYGSILQHSMSELIDSHNDNCVVSCHDAYLINYFHNLAEPNDLLSKLVSQVNVTIMNRFIAARERARKVYPLVSAYDIIMAIPMPDLIAKNKIYDEILLESEHLTDIAIKQYVDAEFINYNPEFENLRKAYEEFLQIFALLKKPNAVISPNRLYGSGNLEETPEFEELAALNQKYADSVLISDNSINIQCAEVYGKSFRDYEVEKIQNSDLPEEIKLLPLRKEELLAKINQAIVKKCYDFLTGFIRDFRNGIRAIQNERKYEEMANELTLVKNNPVKIRTDMGVRCGFCNKVIQYQGRNIHCAPVEGGLQCQYCKSINTI